MLNRRTQIPNPELSQPDGRRAQAARALGERATNPNRAFMVISADAPARIGSADMAKYYGTRFQHTEAIALCETSDMGGVAILRDLPGEGKHAKPQIWVAPYEAAEGRGMSTRIDVGRRANLKPALSPDDAVSLQTFEPVGDYWSEPKVWLNPKSDGLPYEQQGSATIVIDPGPREAIELVSAHDVYEI